MHTRDPNTKMSLGEGGAQSGLGPAGSLNSPPPSHGQHILTHPTPSGVLHLSAICSAELRTGATEEGQPGTRASWL